MRLRGGSNSPVGVSPISHQYRAGHRQMASSSGGGGSGSGSAMGAPGSLSALWYRCNCILRRLWGQHRYVCLLPLAALLALLLTSGGLQRARPSGGGLRGVGLKLGASSPPSRRDLERLNGKLSKMDADDIILWAHQTFPGRLVDVSSFGPSGVVILHKMQQLGILGDVPVVTIDTLHLFPETYEFSKGLGKIFDAMHLRVFRPKGFEDRAAFDEANGSDLWKTNAEKYSYLSKVEPTMRALDEMGASAWMTGRRRSQGGERTELEVLEIDSTDKGRLKINPLAYWTYDDVWNYIREHGVPYNPLHDRGYKSIGDYMTTAPVDDSAAERSGRFVGLGTTECGIHSTRKKIKRMREEAEADGREFDAPGTLPCPSCVEVGPDSFDELVLRGEGDMLLEFYSPMCGGCQEFAPEFKKLARKLKRMAEIQVARFDITEHDVPQSGQDKGLVVEATPSLYLIKRKPFEVISFTGDHEFSPIMNWLKKHTTYIS